MKNNTILLTITYVLLAIAILIVVIILLKRRSKKKYGAILDNLEREKNLIINANILSELNKVETFVNSKELEEKYDEWKKRFEEIKNVDIPGLTDSLIDVEEAFRSKKFKNIETTLAKVELGIYHVKTKANYLLEEIKNLTLSEERNREIVTKLKSKYRKVVSTYRENQNVFKVIQKPIELQFEIVDKLFSSFEVAIESRAYSEIPKIIKALDDSINNLEVVIDESPEIILLGTKIIPKKMSDINSIYQKMTKEGFNLDYLSIEYNTSEAEKKIADIFDRLKVLNLEYSILELKTISSYFDGIYNDFDKERLAKSSFIENGKNIRSKVNKLIKISDSLNQKIDYIKDNYVVTTDDIRGLNILGVSLRGVKEDYEMLCSKAKSKELPYRKLEREMEELTNRLAKLEDNLDSILRLVNVFRNDEQRAREQLDEIKKVLYNSKDKINSYKLPVIPKKYYVELSEATESINEMVKELEKKPLNIEILNMRVDTARDLVLKLYKTTSDIVKTASMSEHAMVYGNRYRANNLKVAKGLDRAEALFYEGKFKESLEEAIKALNIVEPGIHKRLLEESKN